MNRSIRLSALCLAAGAIVLNGCLEDPRKYPNDTPTRLLNEIKLWKGAPAPAPVAAEDTRDARIAALEAELAAERAKPPKVVEKMVKVPLLELRADALFDSGKAELRPNAVKALENAAHALKTFSGNIKVVRVEGHADNQPIHTRQFPDNEALSEARALAVARFLAEHSGLPPKKFIVAGHGDSQPIADNDTAEGRSRNRRVEVSIEQADQ